MTERAITFANDETILRLISKARRRIIAVAPAFSLVVAEALCERWQALGANAVQVVIDPHPDVYRLGFGDFEAANRLEKTGSDLGAMLHRQSGIRIGLIISDDATLIYAPTAQLIDAGPTAPQTPNAILLAAPPPQVERELGAGENGVLDQVIGQDKATLADLKKVEGNLKDNPPQKFDVARTMVVFNAYLEFVELRLTGTYIQRKTVKLPLELMRVADESMRKQLRASFQLIPKDSPLSGEHLANDRNLIVKKHLHVVPKFGTLIKQCDKPAFEESVAKLRTSVEKFRDSLVESLQKTIDADREKLTEALLPLLREKPPSEWIPSYESGKTPDDRTLRWHLDHCLRKAFGSADTLVAGMEVVMMYKAVTYEMLNQPEFLKAVQKAIPNLRALHDEFSAAPGEPTEVSSDAAESSHTGTGI